MIKYSIVDKLFIENWIKLNPSKEGKAFGLFSFESDSVDDLLSKIKDRDKKKSKQIVNSYKVDDPKDRKIENHIGMLDNAKCICKYEKQSTDDFGRTTIKLLEIINHHNEYLDKYLILV